jgi:DNA-binding MarR family transcriptional regulator
MIDAAVRDHINEAITAVARFANSRQLAAVHSAHTGLDLSLSAIGILHQLEAGEPLRPSALAKRLQIALPPLSRQVGALIDGGFVRRTPDDRDGRASLLAITPTGEEALRMFAAANRALLDKALAGWTDAALASLAAQMQRLVGDLRRGGPDDHG